MGKENDQSEVILVTRADLPVQCPQVSDTSKLIHPIIYLPIEDFVDHEATCYYCGQKFKLVEK